jgi:hypothetical protein
MQLSKIFVAAGFSLRDIGTMPSPRKLKLAATKKHNEALNSYKFL